MFKILRIPMIALLLVACQAPGAAPATQERPIPATAAEVPRVTPQELKELVDAGGDVIVADARSQESYDTRHLPGALSMPLAEVGNRHNELSRDAKIVFYCT